MEPTPSTTAIPASRSLNRARGGGAKHDPGPPQWVKVGPRYVLGFHRPRSGLGLFATLTLRPSVLARTFIVTLSPLRRWGALSAVWPFHTSGFGIFNRPLGIDRLATGAYALKAKCWMYRSVMYIYNFYE